MENLKRYCYVDYAMQMPLFSHNTREIEYYREKFKEQLDVLTNGVFNYDQQDEAQAYFMTKGFLYDSWEENENRSYLLAKIIERGGTDGKAFNSIFLTNYGKPDQISRG
jgi:hypothetical protein